MENVEYDRCDSEIIGMVNRNHYCYADRQRLRVIAETRNTVLLEHIEPEVEIFEKPKAFLFCFQVGNYLHQSVKRLCLQRIHTIPPTIL